MKRMIRNSIEEEFEIPPNIKTGKLFFGLDLLGWLIFTPILGISILVGGLIHTLTGGIKVPAILVGTIVSIFYSLLKIDEKTGTCNGILLYDRYKWIRSEKVICLYGREKGDLQIPEVVGGEYQEHQK